VRLDPCAFLHACGGVAEPFSMGEVNIRYPDEWVVTGGRSREEVESELRFQLAVRLFEIGRLSVGKAAELAGWNKVLFMDALGRLQVPVINLDDDEIKAELDAFRGDHPSR